MDFHDEERTFTFHQRNRRLSSFSDRRVERRCLIAQPYEAIVLFDCSEGLRAIYPPLIEDLC